jgi:phosphate transport system permease protein
VDRHSLRLPRSSDRRAERLLGGVAVGVLAFIALMTVTVFVKAWPSFAHNSFYKWFLPGGDVDTQLHNIVENGGSTYHLRTWPLLWGTIITTVASVVIGVVFSTLSAIFIVEFAPAPIRRVVDPVVRLLAGVPSVVYGLIGILALVPWINSHLISQSRKESVQYVVQLNGANVSTATLILTVMITPIMVAIIANALENVPRPWTEGSVALGVNRWRTIWRISVRTARPAIVAAAVLATARALGEAIMLAMVSGGRGFAPNLLDGSTFLFEPARPLAATILQNSDAISQKAVGATLYAMAAVLMVSAVFLSLAGWAAKQPLKRYGIRA